MVFEVADGGEESVSALQGALEDLAVGQLQIRQRDYTGKLGFI